MIKTFNRIILNFLLVFLLLYFAVFSAWYAAYSNYFFFPVVYQMEDIHGHVLKYAPQNRHGRADFVYVAPGIHLKIFADMLKAVENGGEGLNDISYPSEKEDKKFLTDEEIVHLQDVADLIELLKSFWRIVAVLLICAGLAMIFFRVWPYYLSTVLMSAAAVCGALFFTINKYGFKAIFYGLHELVFPPDHRWHFYYQDSLMSTMLKAPDSFADFGGILGVLTLIFFIIFYLLAALFIRNRIKQRGRN